MVQRAWLVVFVLFAGCFSPKFEDAALTCGPSQLCPPGLECGADGLCHVAGAKKDGGGDNVAPAAPQLMSTSPASPANPAGNTVRIIGSSEPLATVTLYSSADCTGAPLGIGTADQLASPGISLTVPDDMTSTFHGTARDEAGNLSPCSSGLAFREDSTAPLAPEFTTTVPASPSRNTMPHIQGTADATDAVSVKLYTTTDCSGTPLGTGAVTAGAFDVQITVPAGVNALYGTVTDAADNTSPCSGSFISYEQDSSSVGVPVFGAPTPTSPNKTILTPMISGTTGEAGLQVKLYTDPACSGTVAGTTTTTSGGAFSLMVTVGANTATTFYGQSTDTAVSLSSLCSPIGVTYQHDNAPPTPPTLVSSLPVSPSNNSSPTVSGTAEPGAEVRLYLDSACTGTLVAMGTADQSGAYSIVGMVTTTNNTFYATATDPATNTSTCSSGGGGTLAYVYDIAPPSAPALPTTNPVSPTATVTNPDLTTTAEANGTVTFFASATCMVGTELGSVSSSSTFYGANVTVPANATTMITALVRDAAGNPSTCSTARTYIHDSLDPAAPLITTANPTSPTNMNSVTVSGTAEASVTVRIYSDATCTAQIGNAVAANGSGMFSVPLSIVDNTTYELHARATDATANTSACGAAFPLIEDSQSPLKPTLTALAPSSTVTMPTVTGSAEAGSLVTIYASNNCTGTVLGTGTATGGGTFSIGITVGMNTNNALSASSRDTALNTSACADPIDYIHDNVAPGTPSMLASNPMSPSTSTTPSITGMAEPGTTVRLFTAAGCGSAVAGLGVVTGGGTFSIPITVGGGSTTTFYATATDEANNPSACTSTGVTYTEDSSDPLPPTMLATNPIGPSSNPMPMVTGNAENGATVKIYTNATCTSAVAGSGLSNGTFSIPVTAPVNSTTDYWAQATDAATNVSACSSATVSYKHDNIVPTNPAITGTLPQSPANANTPTIEGTGEVASTVRIYSASDCGSGLLGTGTVSAFGTFSITSAMLNDNTTTTLYARATDSANNPSACTGPVNFVEDSMAPSNPSNLATNPLSPNNDTTLNVTGNADNGSLVTVYTAAGCGGAAAGSQTSNGTFAVQVSVSSNSTTNFYVRASDAALNLSSCIGPLQYIEDDGIPAAPVMTGVLPLSPSNSNNPQVSGTAEANALVKIYKDAACATTIIGMGTATGGAFAITTTVDANITTNFGATATDAAGNASPCASGLAYLEDSIAPDAPTGLATSPVTNSNDNTPTITGSAEAGSTIRIYSDNTCATLMGTGVTNGGGSFAVDSSAIVDNSTTTYYVRASDAATNVSACLGASITYVENSTATETPTLTGTTPTSPSNGTLSPTVTGVSTVGFTIKIYANSSCTGPDIGTAVAGSGGNFSIAITTPVTANTTTIFYATATNVNPSGCSNGVTYVHDSSPPSAPSITASNPTPPANNNSPTFSGTSEAGATVTLYTNAGCTTPAGGAGSGLVAGNNTFSIVANSTYITNNITNTIYAKAVDVASNGSACSAVFNYVEDSTAPGAPTLSTTTPASPSNTLTSLTVNGNAGAAEAGSTVKIYPTADCSGAFAGSAVAAANGSYSVSVAVSSNSTTTFKGTATDVALNTSGCSASSITYVHDSIAPARVTGLAMNPVGPSNSNTPSVTGNAEATAGTTVTVYTDSACSSVTNWTGPVTSGTFSIPVAVGANTLTTFWAKATDLAGNPSLCSLVSASYSEDSTLPSAPVFTTTTPASPSKANLMPTINGTAEAGSTVKIFANGTCSGAFSWSGPATGGNFAIVVGVSANTTTTFSAITTDAATNDSLCTPVTIVYQHDTIAPAVPVITATNPATTSPQPSSNNNPLVNGTGDSGARIDLYTTAACTTSAANGTVSAGTFSIALAVASNTNTPIYARATDPAGNPSACTAAAVTYYEDSTPPGVPVLTSSLPASPSNNNSPSIRGSTTESGATINLYTAADCSGAAVGTGSSIADLTFAVTASNLPSNATSTIYATATDFAGNASACSATSITYQEDSTAPAKPSGLGMSPSNYSNNNSPSVTGTTDVGTTVRLYTNNTCTSAVAGTLANASSPFSALVSPALTANTITTFWAEATDAAGNPSGCSTSSTTYTEDSAVAVPTFTSTAPLSPSNSSTAVTINGSAEAASSVKIYNVAGCGSGLVGTVTSSGVAGGGTGTFGLATSVGMNTSTTFYATTTDPAGNLSGCTGTGINYIHDSTAPTFTTLTSATAISDTQISLVWVAATDTFTSTANMRYEICIKSSPTGSCASTVTTTGGTGTTLNSLTPSKRYWFSVRAVDLASNTSNAGAYTGNVSDRTFGPGSTKMIATGFGHTCALGSDGKVRCWGDNTAGQLGDGTLVDKQVPTVVLDVGGGANTALDNVIYLAAGGDSLAHSFTCAITADNSGSVYCWGSNSAGQLGNNSMVNSSFPVSAGVNNSIAVATGGEHACSVITTGNVYCWGEGSAGRLGNGDVNPRLTPTVVSGIPHNATTIDAGYFHTCITTGDGKAKCWGAGGNGRLGNGSNTNQLTPVSVSLGGTVYAKQIDLGGYHSCITTANGTAQCWGYNVAGQLGNDDVVDSATPVSVRSGYFMALPLSLSGVTSISAGGGSTNPFTCARLVGGSVRCWGKTVVGETGNGAVGTEYHYASATVTGSAFATQIATGGSHACYLSGSGTIKCWGNGGSYRLGNNATGDQSSPVAVLNLILKEMTVQVESGQNADTACSRLSNGHVACWGVGANGERGIGGSGVNRPFPLEEVVDSTLTPITNVVSLDLGVHHTCALIANGTVMCWGNNSNGELGDASNSSRLHAVPVSGISTAIAIALGSYSSCALLSGGGAQCWGYNGYYNLGNNTNTASNIPVTVGLTGDAIALGATNYSACAVKQDGNVQCWGSNANGVCGNNTSGGTIGVPVTVLDAALAPIVNQRSVVGANTTMCSLSTGGRAWCWGAGTNGELGNGTNAATNDTATTASLTLLRSIGAGNSHFCITRYDGSPFCWGLNTNYQIGIGTAVSPQLSAQLVSGFGTAAQVTGGYGFSCGTHADGTVECWGQGDTGRCGDEDSTVHNVMLANPVSYLP